MNLRQFTDPTMDFQFVEPGYVTFTFQVSSEAGADGLMFYVDGTKVMDLQSDVTRFTTRTFNISRGNHLLMWTYSKDEGQSKGLDEAIISVRPHLLHFLKF